MLEARIQQPGLTILVGAPQIGKTRLLRALCNRLRDPPPRAQRAHVGYARSTGQEPDLFLRALEDLYEHWLEHASYRQQAGKLWDNHKGEIVNLLGKAAAEAFPPLLKTVEASGTLGSSIKTFFQGLVSANVQLKSGGIELPRLQYEQVRDGLQVIHRLSNKRCILVLDALEQSPNVEREAGNLHTYLGDVDVWPPCHILAAVRAPTQRENEDVAYDEACELVKRSAATKMHTLEPMDLDDPKERDRLIGYLRTNVRLSKDVTDEWLHEELNGYPGTLARWLWNEAETKSKSDLQELCKEAFANRYSDVDRILRALRESNRSLFRAALRLVLLPEFASEDGWSPLERAVLDDLDQELHGTAVADLKHAGLVVDDFYPSFGHTTRYEYAKARVLKDYRADGRREAEWLIDALASNLRDISVSTRPLAAAMIEFVKCAPHLRLSDAHMGLCAASASLFGTTIPDHNARLRAVAKKWHDRKATSVLVAMGLLNAIRDAGAEDRQWLLFELRSLAAEHPRDSAVREQLATGLFNAFHDAEAGEGDSFLAELRSLVAEHASDRSVRERLARGLFNAFQRAEAGEGESFLAELRSLAAEHPSDGAVRECLIRGLVNAIHYAQADERKSLLAELRALAAEHPSDGAVRQRLAEGLYNAFRPAKAEEGESFLAELRALAKQHPSDGALREQLAKGLLKAFDVTEAEEGIPLLAELRELAGEYPSDAVAEHLAVGLYIAFQRAGADGSKSLLAELRTLAAEHSTDRAAREWLAMGLLDAFYDAEAEEGESLLVELRRLAAEHPGDGPVRECLAKGLFNAFYDAEAEEGESFLAELRALAAAHPSDGAVREQLAKGLFNAFHDAEAEEGESFLAELRALAAEYPSDGAVREHVAKGLIKAFNVAEAEEGKLFLAELRALATEHPSDGAARDWHAKCLFNALHRAEAEEGESLLAELRALAAEYPSDGAIRQQLARGLYVTFHRAEAPEDKSLLAELRALAIVHSDEAVFREIESLGLKLFEQDESN